MKVRVAILDDDKKYLDRMVAVFSTKYADNLQVYAFTDQEEAVAALSSIRAHVFLSSSAFQVNPKSIPNRCAFAYFVDMSGISTYKDYPAICKFQKLDLIYKQILSLYAETSDAAATQARDGSGKVTMYLSPAGGVGTSTVAAANARYYASLGRKTLFLTLSPYSQSDCFFQAMGTFTFRHVIQAVKSRKINLALKLESYVMQDDCGVYFYAAAPLALDMEELTPEDLHTLIQELSQNGSYDEIIVDLPFALSKNMLELYKRAASLVIVCDGSEAAIKKLVRAQTAIDTLERSGMLTFVSQVYLIYNRCSEKNAKSEALEWTCAGQIPVYDGCSDAQLAEHIAQLSLFDTIQ